MLDKFSENWPEEEPITLFSDVKLLVDEKTESFFLNHLPSALWSPSYGNIRPPLPVWYLVPKKPPNTCPHPPGETQKHFTRTSLDAPKIPAWRLSSG